MGRAGLRRGSPARAPGPPLALGGLVPLVPRHGRDELLGPARDRRRQRALRAHPRGQRPPPGREPPLQHGRLADHRLPRRQRRRAHRRHLPAARPDAGEPRARQGVLRRQPGARSWRSGASGPRDGDGAAMAQARRPPAHPRAGAGGAGGRPGRARRHLRRGGAAGRPRLRPALRRPRLGAQVPAAGRVRLHARLRAAARRRRPGARARGRERAPAAGARPRGGARDAHGHGERRAVRRRRGRLLPLRHAARLERAPLREDARGQRPAGLAVPRRPRCTPRTTTSATRSCTGGWARAPSTTSSRRSGATTSGLRRQPGRRRDVLPARTRTAGRTCRRPSSTRPCTWTGTRWRRGPCSGGPPCSGAPSSPTTPSACSAACTRRRAAATRWRTSCTRTARSATAPRCWATRSAVAAALLDAYEVTGERRWLRRARCLARWAREHLCAPDGRLVDRLAVPGESAGLLAQPVPALDENAGMAEVLLRLEAYTGEARLREQALEILAGWAPHSEQYGVAAARLRAGAAALSGAARPDRRRRPPRRRRGTAAARRRAHRAAPAAHRPVARPRGPADAERLREAGLPGEPAAAAYVCRGHTCSLFQP